MNREREFIEWQQIKGKCKECYRVPKGAIKPCEIEGFCRYDDEARKRWERIIRNS